ncbi:MAG: IPT/TIG domain-containing protein, partial [Thermoanaerobaculia bacterium]
DAIQPAKAGTNTDAFTSLLDPTGAALLYSSFLGGDGGVSGGDRAFGLALDSAGDVWLAGQTDSANFPAKPGAFQITHGGGLFDGFVVKIGDAVSVTSVLPTSGSTAGGTAVTVTGTGFMSGATVTFGGVSATAVSVVSPTTITVSAPAHALGAVNVVVMNLDGQVGTLAGGFTYVTSPALTFTDDPLQAGVTRVKAVHLTELRTAVNTLRSRYALTNFSFTDPTLTANVTKVKAVHLTELRTALAQVYTAASRTVPTWNPGTITVGSVITAAQLTELRTATRALW